MGCGEMLDTGAEIEYNFCRSWGGSPHSKAYWSNAVKPFLGGYPVTGGIAATGQKVI
jgi:hypothetical protein